MALSESDHAAMIARENELHELACVEYQKISDSLGTPEWQENMQRFMAAFRAQLRAEYARQYAYMKND